MCKCFTNLINSWTMIKTSSVAYKMSREISFFTENCGMAAVTTLQGGERCTLEPPPQFRDNHSHLNEQSGIPARPGCAHPHPCWSVKGPGDPFPGVEQFLASQLLHCGSTRGGLRMTEDNNLGRKNLKCAVKVPSTQK